MRRIIATLLLFIAAAAFAQTEDDLVRWVQQNKPLADSGAISQLEFHREMHRRIAAIPADNYPFKLQNLRWIGKRIDIYEALEAGKITREQAERQLAEANAEVESADAAKSNQRAAELRARQERADAERRALALEILRGRMATPQPTYQPQPLQLYQAPHQTTCTGQWVGGTWQTVCR